MAFYKNVPGQKIPVYAYDTANSTAKTGDAANITAQLSKDGGVSAATNDTNPTELDAADHPGVYLFDMLQVESNADLINLTAVSATADITIEPVIIWTTPGSNAGLYAAVQSMITDAISAAAVSAAAVTKIQSGLSTLAAGAQMDLVDAPNATAVTAIQSGLSTLAAGAQMDLVDAPNATAIAAIQSGIAPPTVEEIDAQLSLTHTAGSWGSSGASGSETVIIAVTELDTTPIPDVFIDILSTGGALLDSKVADSNGQATFALDPDDYYIRMRKAGVSFTVPEEITVTTDDTFTLIGTVVTPSAGDASLQTLTGYYAPPGLAPSEGVTVSAKIKQDNQYAQSVVFTRQSTETTTNGAGYAALSLAKGGTFLITASYNGIQFLALTITVSADDTKDITAYLAE